MHGPSLGRIQSLELTIQHLKELTQQRSRLKERETIRLHKTIRDRFRKGIVEALDEIRAEPEAHGVTLEHIPLIDRLKSDIKTGRTPTQIEAVLSKTCGLKNPVIPAKVHHHKNGRIYT